MKKKKASYLNLFLTMLKIGAFTFGGGYAMIALLEIELIEKKKWIGKEEFLDMVAIAESTPGPVAINSATYIGYKTGGVIGSAVATLGVVIPSFTVIFLISLFYDAFLSLDFVGRGFRGIQVCVVYLIFSAGLKLLRQLERSVFNAVVLLPVAAVMLLSSLFARGFSSALCLLLCGGAGLAVYWCAPRRKKGGDFS